MKWGYAEDGVGRNATYRMLIFLHTITPCGKVFFINKAIQRIKPGNLVLPHAAETASVAVGSCCHLPMHATIAQFNFVLHRS